MLNSDRAKAKTGSQSDGSESDEQAPVGKTSRVTNTFGTGPHGPGRQAVTTSGKPVGPVPTGGGSNPLKRKEMDGAEEDGRGGKRRGGEDGGGSGGGASDSSGVGKEPEQGFPYRMAEKAIGAVNVTGAPVRNAVQLPAVGPAKNPGQGYVAAVLTVADGKDKGPKEVADQYAAEAFENRADASKRFALAVGVNRMTSVVKPEAEVHAELDKEVATVHAVHEFPVTAIKRTWTPTWLHNDPGTPNHNQPVDNLEEVRAAAQHNTAAAKAAEDVSKSKMVPTGPLRTQVLRETNPHVSALEQRYANVYVHTGDADAVNLKAKALPTDAKPTGLFDRYDQVIGDHQAKHGQAPMIASGGYEFRVHPEQQPPGVVHEDPHKGKAATTSRQTAATASLTMDVRQQQGNVNANVPYMPEPNMLIHGSKSKLDTTNFGTGSAEESRAVTRSIMGAKPKAEVANREMVFDQRAALYTDGGRFDKDKIKSDPDYAKGKTNMSGLLSGSQAGADLRTIVKDTWQKTMSGQFDKKVFEVATVYMPKELLEKHADAKTLAELKPYLQKFTSIVTAIDTAVHAAFAHARVDAKAKDADQQREAAAAEIDKALESLPAVEIGNVSQAVFHDRAKLRATIMDYGKKLRAIHNAESQSQATNQVGGNKAKQTAAIKVARTEEGGTDEQAKKRIEDLLATCKAAAIAVANFLHTFEEMPAMADGAAASSSRASTPASDRMDVDQHPLV